MLGFVFRLGWVLYDSGRYEEATIGNDYYELNQYEKALKAYEKAIELRPAIGL